MKLEPFNRMNSRPKHEPAISLIEIAKELGVSNSSAGMAIKEYGRMSPSAFAGANFSRSATKYFKKSEAKKFIEWYRGTSK
jgi:DNA-binding transcriptional regulator GbsR (MarR family)